MYITSLFSAVSQDTEAQRIQRKKTKDIVWNKRKVFKLEYF